jgi:predicted TIM-barrel fold metal-dependent hydrolase
MLGEYGLGGVGPVMEDTLLAMHLIVRQIPLRYPNVKVIISHLGGLMPNFLGRMDHQLGPHALAEPASATARRFYYDTVGHGCEAALLAAWKAFGADHLVPGSDWPVLLRGESYKATFDYVRHSDIPADDVDKIIHRNAPALFPRLS